MKNSNDEPTTLTTEEATNPTVEVTEAPAKTSRDDILAQLSAAMADGKITKRQLQSMRFDLGVTQGTFTRKQTTKAQRKSRSKMQKASRRKNR